MFRKDKGKKATKAQGAPRVAQTREVFLVDELGRFVVGATASGLAIEERLVKKETLEAARLLVASRGVPPGTFESRADANAAVTVAAGEELFACSGADAGVKREVPHELFAVVTAFERGAASEIAVGGLSHASISGFAALAAQALAGPSEIVDAPQPPLAFARTSFRPSGARVAMDLEIVNGTPWDATSARIEFQFDAKAFDLVSVKASDGLFEDGILRLPGLKARTKERAVLLFEPRQAGMHVVRGALTLAFEGRPAGIYPARRARTMVAPAQVSANVPRSLVDFMVLVETALTHRAQMDLAEGLEGLASVAGLATEVERDAFAKILDWHGPQGARQLWYLGAMPGSRPIMVELTTASGQGAKVVLAAASVSDLIGYAALLRGRLLKSAGLVAPKRVVADEKPEVVEAVLHGSLVARAMSAELPTFDAAAPKPGKARKPTTTVSGTMGAAMTSRSAGEEMVPGLIDAVERVLAPKRAQGPG